jgi:preprotein translocase subunit SecG
MLHLLLMSVHIFAALGIIGLVLIQRGKGADAGAGFGAGASGTVFGARGAGTALSRATAILAAVFMVTSLSLTYVGSHTAEAPASNSVLDRLSTTPASAPAGSVAPVAPVTTPAQAPASTPAPAPAK